MARPGRYDLTEERRDAVEAMLEAVLSGWPSPDPVEVLTASRVVADAFGIASAWDWPAGSRIDETPAEDED